MESGPQVNLTFFFISQQLNNHFFDAVREGCVGEAKRLTETKGTNATVKCEYLYPQNPDIWEQVAVVRDLIRDPARTVHGMMILPAHPADLLAPVIDEAAQKGIPCVVLNEDIPKSKRLAAIATDNYALGRTLGKILLQLRPNGGKYATITAGGETLDLRAAGLEEYLDDTPWEFLGERDCQDTISLAMDLVDALPEEEPSLTAVVPLGGWPMYDPVRWSYFADRYGGNITLVSADALPLQIDLLNSGHVDGLAGQASYQIGSKALEVLFNHRFNPNETLPEEIYITSVLEYVRVPLVLPELIVDMNYIGNLRIVGYTMFALIVFTAVACAVWVWIFRKMRVVRVSQPMFLLMIVIGALLMGSTLIPLSIDDSSSSTANATGVCMAIPWLGCLGFTVTFSALSSKTWRVNRMFNDERKYSRIRATDTDVLYPFFLLLGANVLVLILWTLLDPLTYARRAHQGTDGWNRVISSYGSCSSENLLPFLIPLAVLNIGVLVISNWQAYKARLIESEFSESTYIGFVMAIFLQCSLTALPVLFVISDHPQAYYLVLTSSIFILNMAILLIIFVPKAVMVERLRRQSDDAQARYIEDSVRLSQQRTSSRRRANSNSSTDNIRIGGGGVACSMCGQVRLRPSTQHKQVLEDIPSSNKTPTSGEPSVKPKVQEESTNERNDGSRHPHDRTLSSSHDVKEKTEAVLTKHGEAESLDNPRSDNSWLVW